MTDAKKPMAEANRISSMLNTVLGADRFPVKVDELALEYSRQCFADSPIDTVRGEDLDGFDGLLKANKARSKWLVLYNSATPSEGRKRFTIAHEFGHYILHRHQQDLFECGDDDIETGDNNEARHRGRGGSVRIDPADAAGRLPAPGSTGNRSASICSVTAPIVMGYR
jgi:hypothetical protein